MWCNFGTGNGVGLGWPSDRRARVELRGSNLNPKGPDARADYAEAAATVLAGGDHAGRTYELAGDASFMLAELVAVVADASGKPVTYENMSPEDLKAAATKAGVPEMFAMVLSDTDAGVAKGPLFDDGGELARLIGRPTTPFRSTITTFVQNPPSSGTPTSHT